LQAADTAAPRPGRSSRAGAIAAMKTTTPRDISGRRRLELWNLAVPIYLGFPPLLLDFICESDLISERRETHIFSLIRPPPINISPYCITVFSHHN
jgi:hypothetical protein